MRCVHLPTGPSRSLRPLTLGSGTWGRAGRGFAAIDPVLDGLLVEGLIVLRGLILDGLILDGLILVLDDLPLTTEAIGRCFQQADCQLRERLQQPEGQLTQELEQQHGLADGESEPRPDPFQ